MNAIQQPQYSASAYYDTIRQHSRRGSIIFHNLIISGSGGSTYGATHDVTSSQQRRSLIATC